MTKEEWKITAVYSINHIDFFTNKNGLKLYKTRNLSAKREVVLTNSKGENTRVIVEDPKLSELLENYHRGYSLVDRERKYLNLYIVYESLSPSEDIIFKAIRNSFSHSRKKLTHKQTINVLETLFGDIKIDLDKYKHKKIFNARYKELLNECNKLLMNEILKIGIPETRYILRN